MSDGVDSGSSERQGAGPGPGERLQAARIQQGLSLDDVANRMHLSPSILESIEENNFEEITAPIFVKGYLRAYARIVSLDEDEMIEQYARFFSGEDPPISSVSNVAPELSAADARMKWTTIVVILVLAVLLTAWWWNREQGGQAPISLDAQAPTGEQGISQSTAASDEIEAVSEAPQEASSETETVIAETTGSVTETPEPTPEAPVEPAGDETIELAAQTESTDDPAPAAANEEAASEAPADVAPVASGAVRNEQAPSGNDRLEIIVNADTWADIKDATGYQLVYDLLRADRRLELTGQAPFSVFLGNGHGVELRLNEGEIDLGGRIRDDNTVRIRVGG